MLSYGGEEVIKLNEQEKEVLNEIKNGKTEFLFNRESHEPTQGKPLVLFNLINFGYISGKKVNTKDGVGYTDIRITQKDN